MAETNFCISCFNKMDGNPQYCPYCGYEQSDIPKEKFHLYPRTILSNRYMIGHVCGSGGFGITYKAWDMQLNEIVAVKELFPAGMVQRAPGKSEIIIFGSKQSEFEKEKDHFLREARTMAKFPENDNVVSVYNFFEENNTAYIVMEYLDGISLKDYLKQNGGKFDLNTALEIEKEVLNGLKSIHAMKIVHRDISADNIMLTINNKIKLFDFGAAHLSSDDDLTRTIVVKKGYAPQEQYRQKSKQGPYTDVYAAGALFYLMLTGELPPESVDRISNNEKLKKPSELVQGIPAYIDKAILRALSLKPELRFQNAEEFLNVLTKETEVLVPEEVLKKRKIIRRISAAVIALVLTTVIAVASVMSYGVSNFHITEQEPISILMVRPEGVDAKNDDKVRKEIISNYRFYMSNNKYRNSDKFDESLITIDFATPSEYVNVLLNEENAAKYDLFVTDYFTDEKRAGTDNIKWVSKKLEDKFVFDFYYTDNSIPIQFDFDVMYINYSLFKGSKEDAVKQVRTSLKDVTTNGYKGCIIDPQSGLGYTICEKEPTETEINAINSRITGNSKVLTSKECSALFAQGKLEAYVGKYSQRDFDRKNIKDLLIVPLSIYGEDFKIDDYGVVGVYPERRQSWGVKTDLTKNQKYEAMYMICCIADTNTQQMLSAYGYSEYLSADKTFVKKSDVVDFAKKALLEETIY